MSKNFKTIPLLSLLRDSFGIPVMRMPGKSHRGPLPEFSGEELALSGRLEKHVKVMATEIGERNLVHFENLEKCASYIEETFSSSEYEPAIQEFKAEADWVDSAWNYTDFQEHVYKNVIAELKGSEKPDEIIVLGSHYDSATLEGCRGANDNASGVAAVLELASHFMKKGLQKRTLRFVAFPNEEPPYFWTKAMGSYAYAAECKRKNENILAMLTPETIGYYSDEKDSQHYPTSLLKLFYPSEGNYIAFVGNTDSKKLISDCVKTFRDTTAFPCEGTALPTVIPRVGSSDHWPFWQMGYPAFMITDTAPYRYPFYHTASDNPDKIDYGRMARVVSGIAKVMEKLANGPITDFCA